MKNKRPSLDGFVSRGTPAALGGHHQKKPDENSLRQTLHTSSRRESAELSTKPTETTIGRASIRESLQSLDNDSPAEKKVSRREKQRLRREKKHAHPRRRRLIKWAIILVITAIVAVVAYTAIVAFITTNKIFEGGIFGLTQKQALKEDANGRSNFIIFGTAEDDEGGEHGGANLTDSLMVLSVNQTTKDAFMVSIPRDLWVEFGTACLSGYQGKANEIYSCYSNDGQDEAAGTAALQKKVGGILGLDIQYYAHLNFTAVTELVDAVGGVDVTIESEDPRGILDRNFDWKCGYRCYLVKYDNGQKVHLDGVHALALARARNAAGGYGLPNGNFDREKNQQKIIKALREKAMSAGTLTNLGKVTGIMNALGNNLRTNIDTKEIQTLMSIANDIPSDAIHSLTLVDKENPLVTTGMIGASSAVYPIAGQFNYTAIQAYIAKHATSNPVSKEGARIVVLNGTDTAGVAQIEADALTAKGYTISAYDNAPDGSYGAVEIYKIGEGNTATAEALKKYYQVDTIKTSTPPLAVDKNVSFVIVIGKVRN